MPDNITHNGIPREENTPNSRFSVKIMMFGDILN